MTGLIFTVALTATFICLFFRQDRLERRAAQRRAMEGDLHVLKEMKKFLNEKGQDTSMYDIAIKEIEA